MTTCRCSPTPTSSTPTTPRPPQPEPGSSTILSRADASELEAVELDCVVVEVHLQTERLRWHTDDFLIVCMPKWLAKNAELLGMTPELVGDWTDAQRATWETLGRLASSINCRIANAKRRPRAKHSFGATA